MARACDCVPSCDAKNWYVCTGRCFTAEPKTQDLAARQLDSEPQLQFASMHAGPVQNMVFGRWFFGYMVLGRGFFQTVDTEYGFW